jgi:hypothetical protein
LGEACEVVVEGFPGAVPAGDPRVVEFCAVPRQCGDLLVVVRPDSAYRDTVSVDEAAVRHPLILFSGAGLAFCCPAADLGCVGGPVTGGGSLPFEGDGDVDTEGAGEDRRGQLGPG